MTLLRPRWVAGHLLVLALTASFIALGFWQLARNNHKHALVREARAAFAAPAPDITTAVTEGGRAEAKGHYDPEHEVLLRNQVHDGKDGNDVLTPLVMQNGAAVLVDRGWTASVGITGNRLVTVTQAGDVVVRGIAHTSSTLSPQDTVSDTGGQLALPRVDLARIGQGLPYKLQPNWIQAQAQIPEPIAGAPLLPQPPAPDQVNHMEYTIEWFSFALIGIIGWPVALIGFSRRRGGFSTPGPDE